MARHKILSLAMLLKEDTPVIKEIRSLFDREEGYGPFLAAIEQAIAEYYIEHRDTTDKQVSATLKHLEKTYMHDLNSFQDKLSIRILAYLGMALEEKSITHHELKLTFSYIRWSIDNRSWMPGKQAYVRWIANAIGLFDEKEQMAYEREARKITKRFGIPGHVVDSMILMRDEITDIPNDDGHSRAESEFFALDDKEKFDTVIKQFPTRPELLFTYAGELEEQGDQETVERLFKRVLDIAHGFPPIVMELGLLYKRKGNPHLARHHLEQALAGFENVPGGIIDEREKKRLQKEIRDELKNL